MKRIILLSVCLVGCSSEQTVATKPDYFEQYTAAQSLYLQESANYDRIKKTYPLSSDQVFNAMRSKAEAKRLSDYAYKQLMEDLESSVK